MPKGTAIPLNPDLKGVNTEHPLHLIPEGFLYDADNVLTSDGILKPRPGYAKLVSDTLGGTDKTVIGIKSFVEADDSETLHLLAVNMDTVEKYNSSTEVWDTISGAPSLTGTSSDLARMIIWPQQQINYMIGVNNVNAPFEYDSDAGTMSALTGILTNFTAKDITVCANRIIYGNCKYGSSAVRFPSRVHWGKFNDRDDMEVSAFNDLTDTEDVIVGVRRLTRTAFAIHKGNSQWLGVAQTGVAPWRFELIDQQPGPCSPASIVTHHGGHYYLANDGSIYFFDGVRSKEIGKPIHDWLQETMNFNALGQAHGYYDPIDHMIWFFFVGSTDTTPKYAVSFDPHIQNGGFFPHSYSEGITASEVGYRIENFISYADAGTLGLTYDSLGEYSSYISFASLGEEVVLYGNTASNIYKSRAEYTDDGTTFTSHWTYPVRPILQDLTQQWKVNGVESFFKQTSVSQDVDISVAKSDTVATQPPFDSGTTVDISIDERHRHKPYNTDGRFIAVKHSLTPNEGGIEWRGGALYVTTQKVD